jgi:hypothetical protein
VRREEGTAPPRRRTSARPRTECLTPLAVALGLVLWGVIILLVRALL